MKKLLYLLVAALMALTVVSCEKGNKTKKNPYFFSLKTEIADFDQSYPLLYAWYYYSETLKGYDIVFSDQPDFTSLKENNFFALDIHKSFCGTKQAITSSLSTEDWGCFFLNGSTNPNRYDDNEFKEGTLFVDVSEDGHITMEVVGTTLDGVQIRAKFDGQGERMDQFVSPGVYLDEVHYSSDSKTEFFRSVYAWYYYDEDCGGYDIIMLDQPDLSKAKEGHYFVFDLHESFCGKFQELTSNLHYAQDENNKWNFYFAISGEQYFGGSCNSGSVFLNVEQEKNFIALHLTGTGKDGGSFVVHYKGRAIRSEGYLSVFLDW